MNRRKGAVILIGIGSFLLAAALALGAYNLWADYRAGRAVSGVLDRLSIDMPANGMPDYLLNPKMDMPTKEIDGYRYIGKVSVPALDLELPVMETWDYTRMRIAPCRYAGSAYLNDFVICAHNYVSHFGRLKNLSPGDRVRFTDMDGNTFFYEVKQIETLSDTAVEEMVVGDWDLTLFTCTLNGQMRVTVRCDLVETSAQDAVRMTGKTQFSDAF